MQLKEKRTGKLIEIGGGIVNGPGFTMSLDAFAEQYEIVETEKPKKYWFIDYGGRIKAMNDADDGEDVARKEIGNYFETKEEAEKAVERLRVWKRLKDKGFEFEGCFKDNTINYDFVKRPLNYDENEEAEQDLAFLFGGEE